MTDIPPAAGPGVTPQRNSRHRGRPRSERAERAVLEATAAILYEDGFAALTADGIAHRAGVSKATIYKWWPTKAAVAVDAFLADVQAQVPDPDTGDLAGDLKVPALRQVHLFRDTPVGRVLASLVAAAQSDADVAEALRTRWIRPRRTRAAVAVTRAKERGEIPPDTDAEAVLDLVFGPIYYRLLTGHAPLEDSLVDVLVDSVVHGLRPRA